MTPYAGPTTDPIDEPPGTDDATRTLVPRTVMTAGTWLEQREEAQRIIALPAVQQVRRALPRYTCLGCGDALPAGRGGHCQSCVEWGE